MKNKRISDLPEKEFNGEDINNFIYIQNTSVYNPQIVRLPKVFEWIKKEAIKNGLKVEMSGERIMFIKG